MKLNKRFSLSTLLLVMLVVASVFGYLQWRRQRIIADVNWLNEMNGPLTVGQGVSVERYNTLPELVVRGGILPEVLAFADADGFVTTGRSVLAAKVIQIRFAKVGEDSYRLGGDNEPDTLERLKERLSEIQNRLAVSGLSSVEFCEHKGGTFFNYCSEWTSVDEIGE